MTITDGELLPLKDGDLHVRQDGPRDAPALLLIHGTAATARTWDALTPLLTGSHRVFRIDLLGHGRSAKPAGAGYTVPDHARRAAEALDLLGVERAAVAGHSSGGTVATALAEQRPGLVSALALVGTGPGMDAFTGPETGGAPATWPPGDELIPGVGHTPIMEDPVRTAELFLSFM